MKLNYLIYGLSLLVLAASCGYRQEPAQNMNQKPDSQANYFVQANKGLVQYDRERIVQFLDSNNLSMTETPMGYWVQLLEAGSGDSIFSGDRVVFSYSVYLLGGKLCYSSNETGVKIVVIDNQELESGLHHLLKTLRVGDSVRVILPPFLAYGLTGDGNKIPRRAILDYRLKVIDKQP